MSVGERTSSHAKHITADDVWNMPEVPGMQLEINEGILVQVPGASFGHHLVVMAILRVLDAFISEHELGYVMPDGLAYLLHRDPDILRIPDVSVVLYESFPDDADLTGYWNGAPDLAVEVVSPNDNANELHSKIQQYLEAGTCVVWVVWPARQSVTIHTPDMHARELIHDALLDGGDVLTDFSIPISELFSQLPSERESPEDTGV